MILYFWSFHPHLEDDWLDACSGLDDVSHDNDIVDITDDLNRVDTVGCPVTLSDSLDSPSDHMFYAVDVCNHLSSLSIENSQIIESTHVINSTCNIATSSSNADDMSSGSSSASLKTSSTKYL